MDIDVTTSRSGPVFDGRARAAVRAYIDDAEQQVADAGENLVQAELGRVLRHPTGYYESRIQTDRAGGDSVVTDGNVIYGPWLEGVGSRNAPKTRFAGYGAFRRITAVLQSRAHAIAERVLPKYLRRME